MEYTQYDKRNLEIRMQSKAPRWGTNPFKYNHEDKHVNQCLKYLYESARRILTNLTRPSTVKDVTTYLAILHNVLINVTHKDFHLTVVV